MNTCRKACSNVSIKALVAFFVAVFAVVVLSGCASQSYTPEKKQSILSASALHTDGVLRVGVDASSAPYAAQHKVTLWVLMLISLLLLLMRWV